MRMRLLSLLTLTFTLSLGAGFLASCSGICTESNCVCDGGSCVFECDQSGCNHACDGGDCDAACDGGGCNQSCDGDASCANRRMGLGSPVRAVLR